VFGHVGKPEEKRRIGIEFGLLYIFTLSGAGVHRYPDEELAFNI